MKKTIIWPETVSIRKPPINLADEDRALFQHEFTRRLPAVHLAELRGVDIIGDLLRWRSRLLCSYTHVPWETPSLNAALRRFTRYVRRRRHVAKGTWITNNLGAGIFIG